MEINKRVIEEANCMLETNQTIDRLLQYIMYQKVLSIKI